MMACAEGPLQLLFEREGLPAFDLPEPLRSGYGGPFGLGEQCRNRGTSSAEAARLTVS